MTKKILIILILVLVIATLSIGAWILLNSMENGEGGAQNPLSGVFGFLTPDEEGLDTQTPFPDTETPANTDTNFDDTRDIFIPELRQLSDTPVAGATFVGTSTVRYTDRGVGHIYDASVISYHTQKIANTTIPQVYRAIWSQSGNTAVYQRLQNGALTSTIVSLEETGTTTQRVSTTPLPSNMSDIERRESQDGFVYAVPTSNQSSRVQVIDALGTIAQSFSLPGTEWSVHVTNTSVLAFQKPLIGRTGVLLNSSGTTLGSGTGLSAHIAPDQSIELRSTHDTNSITFAARGEGDEFEQLFPSTFPEKCVFETSTTFICAVPEQRLTGNVQEGWYQGAVSFVDNLWRYNTETNDSEELYTPGEELDIIEPQLNESGDHLLFINKKDLSLWVLRIAED